MAIDGHNSEGMAAMNLSYTSVDIGIFIGYIYHEREHEGHGVMAVGETTRWRVFNLVFGVTLSQHFLSQRPVR